MPLALTIPGICRETSPAPTHLLENRSGWKVSSQLTLAVSAGAGNRPAIGASHQAGSFVWDKTYPPSAIGEQPSREMVDASPLPGWTGPQPTYLIWHDLQAMR